MDDAMNNGCWYWAKRADGADAFEFKVRVVRPVGRDAVIFHVNGFVCRTAVVLVREV